MERNCGLAITTDSINPRAGSGDYLQLEFVLMGAPSGSMVDDPTQKRLLKTDILAGFFTFDPFVAEDFPALRSALLKEAGSFERATPGIVLWLRVHGWSEMQRR